MPHLIKELSGKYERCRFQAGTALAYRVASAHLLVERSPCPLRHSADLEGHRTDVELTLAQGLGGVVDPAEVEQPSSTSDPL